MKWHILTILSLLMGSGLAGAVTNCSGGIKEEVSNGKKMATCNCRVGSEGNARIVKVSYAFYEGTDISAGVDQRCKEAQTTLVDNSKKSVNYYGPTESQFKGCSTREAGNQCKGSAQVNESKGVKIGKSNVGGYEFDSQGNLETITVDDGAGKKTTTKYEFGKPVKVIERTEDPTTHVVSERDVTKYNAKGEVVLQRNVGRDEQGFVNNRDVYKKDELGNVTYKDVDIDASGNRTKNKMTFAPGSDVNQDNVVQKEKVLLDESASRDDKIKTGVTSFKHKGNGEVDQFEVINGNAGGVTTTTTHKNKGDLGITSNKTVETEYEVTGDNKSKYHSTKTTQHGFAGIRKSAEESETITRDDGTELTRTTTKKGLFGKEKSVITDKAGNVVNMSDEDFQKEVDQITANDMSAPEGTGAGAGKGDPEQCDPTVRSVVQGSTPSDVKCSALVASGESDVKCNADIVDNTNSEILFADVIYPSKIDSNSSCAEFFGEDMLTGGFKESAGFKSQRRFYALIQAKYCSDKATKLKKCEDFGITSNGADIICAAELTQYQTDNNLVIANGNCRKKCVDKFGPDLISCVSNPDYAKKVISEVYKPCATYNSVAEINDYEDGTDEIASFDGQFSCEKEGAHTADWKACKRLVQTYSAAFAAEQGMGMVNTGREIASQTSIQNDLNANMNSTEGGDLQQAALDASKKTYKNKASIEATKLAFYTTQAAVLGGMLGSWPVPKNVGKHCKACPDCCANAPNYGVKKFFPNYETKQKMTMELMKVVGKATMAGIMMDQNNKMANIVDQYKKQTAPTEDASDDGYLVSLCQVEPTNIQCRGRGNLVRNGGLTFGAGGSISGGGDMDLGLSGPTDFGGDSLGDYGDSVASAGPVAGVGSAFNPDVAAAAGAFDAPAAASNAISNGAGGGGAGGGGGGGASAPGLSRDPAAASSESGAGDIKVGGSGFKGYSSGKAGASNWKGDGSKAESVNPFSGLFGKKSGDGSDRGPASQEIDSPASSLFDKISARYAEAQKRKLLLDAEVK